MSHFPMLQSVGSTFSFLDSGVSPSTSSASSTQLKFEENHDRVPGKGPSDQKEHLNQGQTSEDKMPQISRQVNLSSYVPFGSFTKPIDPTALDTISDDWYEVWDCREPYEADLCTSRWIRCFRRRHLVQRDFSTTRVYILPRDRASNDMLYSLKSVGGKLFSLIAVLDVTAASWQGHGTPRDVSDVRRRQERQPHANAIHVQASTGAEEESLFYIFNTIDSPLPEPREFKARHDQCVAEDILMGNRDQEYGMRTTLYPYQRRSVVTMMKKEVQPRLALDPRLTKMTDHNGESYYIDLAMHSIRRDGDLYEDPRGGILAETMGYGKTFIMIALILATRYHIPQVPADSQLESVPRGRSGARPLTLVTADLARRLSLPWPGFFQEKLDYDGQDFAACRALLSRPRTYAIGPSQPTRVTRAPQPYRTMHLSSATLIVVPHNLFQQWRQEFKKHLYPGTLDILEIDYKYPRLPTTGEIARYDVVLIEQRRFRKEMDSYISDPTAPAPLQDVHFLRLAVDEGHEFASSGAAGRWNKLSQVTADCRWVVTGTPTSGMVGAEIELAADQGVEEAPASSASQQTDLASQRQEQTDALLARRQARKAQDSGDLVRLGRIVKGLLQAQPWCNSGQSGDVAQWNQYTAITNSGIHHGMTNAATSVRSILQSLVVRHRLSDIEPELPPLHNRAVTLQPTLYDRYTIDMFTLVMACNGITSERTDQDYLFDKRNRRSLDQLIRNLRRSSFFWLGFSKKDIEQTLQRLSKYVDEHGEGMAESDRDIVRAAQAVIPQILSDGIWHWLSQVQEVGYSVNNLPEAVAVKFGIDEQSTMRELNGSGNPFSVTSFAAMPATKVIGIQADVNARVDKGQPDPLREFCRAIGDLTYDGDKSETRSMFKDTVGANVGSAVKPAGLVGVPMSGFRKDIALKTKSFEARKTLGSMKMPKMQRRTDNGIGASAPLSAGNIHLTGSMSAKLSYLLQRVLDLYETEKILIFYEGDDIAWYIAQGLEILGVAHFIYANGIGPSKRDEYLRTFSRKRSEERVMLVDLKQGAHGLNITAASRIFFVNPVWSAGQEAQAVKRAHRIGQTKPVYVETLVLKDSIEEAMWKRRIQLSPEERRLVDKNPLDDEQILQILQDYRFRVQDGEVGAIAEEERFAAIRQAPMLFSKLHEYLGKTTGESGKSTKSQAEQHTTAKSNLSTGVPQDAGTGQNTAVADLSSQPVTQTNQPPQLPVSTNSAISEAGDPATAHGHRSALQEENDEKNDERHIKRARFE